MSAAPADPGNSHAAQLDKLPRAFTRRLAVDERVILSGSSDSTVRVWDVSSGDMVNTLIHHCEAVLVMAQTLLTIPESVQGFLILKG